MNELGGVNVGNKIVDQLEIGCLGVWGLGRLSKKTIT
jgi:hypothetical protein